MSKLFIAVFALCVTTLAWPAAAPLRRVDLRNARAVLELPQSDPGRYAKKLRNSGPSAFTLMRVGFFQALRDVAHPHSFA